MTGKIVLAISMLAAVSVLPVFAEAPVKPTVAVIGTGDMGDSLGPRLAGLGYPVIYGTRDPQSEKVQQLLAQTGNGAKAASAAEAAGAAEIVILAVPWPAMDSVAQNLGDMKGKVTVAKLNIDENPHTPAKYGVKGIPTLIVFKGGQVAATKLGALPKSQLIQWIESVI